MNIELPWKDLDFLEKWQEWEQYRRERKLPKYVPTGLKKTLARLYNLSGGNKEVAKKIIDQSIEQNYQGLFELKQQYGTSTNKQPVTGGRNKRNNGAYQLLSDLKEDLAAGDAESV